MKKNISFVLLIVIIFMQAKEIKAQQFNTDNYLAMPHGTLTTTMTIGQRNATILPSFALFANWEFFVQTNIFWENKELGLMQHFATSLYAKYMFFENNEKNAGFAMFLGYGKSPGYYNQEDFMSTHSNIWTAAALTIPFWGGTLSLDLMPGGIVDFDYGNNKKTAWGFTYSTRLAVYKIIPQCAIVGELFGTAGELYSKPEYKVGIRWEPNATVIPALTYGSSFKGTRTAGIELGVMIFSPQFLKL